MQHHAAVQFQRGVRDDGVVVRRRLDRAADVGAGAQRQLNRPIHGLVRQHGAVQLAARIHADAQLAQVVDERVVEAGQQVAELAGHRAAFDRHGHPFLDMDAHRFVADQRYAGDAGVHHDHALGRPFHRRQAGFQAIPG
ncbi:hypothetical protein D3C87_1763770 [compost metagenome]